jgi:hypothetical protein
MNPGAGSLGASNGEVLASQPASGNVGSYYASVGAFGTATSDVSLSVSGAINSFALIGYLRTTNATYAVDFDELRIGTTWASVTPAGTVNNADFNDDGDVDGQDFLTWQAGFGRTGTGTLSTGDANADTNVNGSDYDIWAAQFGATGLSVTASAPVPEPAGLVALVLGISGVLSLRRRQS